MKLKGSLLAAFKENGMNVKTTLVILTSLVVFPAVILIIFFSYYAGNNIINTQINRELDQTTMSIMDSVNRFVYDRYNDMQILISDSLLNNPEISYEEKNDILRVNLLNLGWYDNLFLTDPDGTIVSGTDSTVLGESVAGLDWYQQTQRDFIHVSGVVELPFHPDKDVLVFANTLVDKNKKILGVVFAEFSFSILDDLLASNSSENIDVFLMTQEGDTIASKADKELDGLDVFQNNEYIFYQTESEGYLSFDGNGWKLLLGISKELAYRPLKNFFNIILFISLFVVLEVFVVGSYLAKLFVRPIDVLTEGVKEIEKGNWSHHIEIGQKNEFGYLADNFNTMTASIQEKNRHLMEERGKYKSILDSSEVGIILFNTKNEVIAYNERFCELFACPQGNGQEAHAREVLSFLDQKVEDPRVQSILNGLLKIRDAADSKQNVHCEITLEEPEMQIFSLYTKPVKTEEETLLGRIWSFHDVTEQRLVEKDKYDFITVASHNMRTPLTVVNWSADILETSEDLNEDQQEAVHNIRSNCERLTALMNILLGASEVKDGKVQINESTFSLTDIVKKVSKSMQHYMSDKEGLTIDISNVEDQAAIQVLADEEKVTHILYSLLENACLYGREGSENKVVVTLETNVSKGEVTVNVFDQGVGIPVEEEEHVFDKFTRGEEAMKIHTDGIGLSLYLSKIFIDSLGQRIWFNRQNQGTSFHFTLKLQASGNDVNPGKQNNNGNELEENR